MSLGDLAGAGVGGDDCTEVRRQPEGCLPVPSGAVPGEVVCGDKRGEVRKEGVRVGGSVCLVTVCVVGEGRNAKKGRLLYNCKSNFLKLLCQ